MKVKQNILVTSTLIVSIFACLLLNACVSNNYGSNQLDYAVDYYVRGPEFILRDLGNQRYLLAQDEYVPASNRVTHYRYYDRQSGTLTKLNPIYWLVENRLVYTRLPVRYASDNPLVIAFLDGNISETKLNYPSPDDKDWNAVNGSMKILLSQDGGKTFLSRNVIVPGALAEKNLMREDMVFAEVHHQTLYIGIITHDMRGAYRYDAHDKLARNKDDIAIARRIQEPVFGQLGSATGYPPVEKYLSVMSITLPETDKQEVHPLSFGNDDARRHYESSLPSLVAVRLTGRNLEDYKIAPTEIEAKLKLEEFHDIEFNKRQDLVNYIEPLKALHPEWSASQKLNEIPTWVRYEARQKVAERFAKKPPLPEDPIEWLHF